MPIYKREIARTSISTKSQTSDCDADKAPHSNDRAPGISHESVLYGKRQRSKVPKILRFIFSWLRSKFTSRTKKTKVLPFNADSSGNLVVTESKQTRVQMLIHSWGSKYAKNEKKFRRKYSTFEIIGNGTFSTVRKALCKNTQTKVVIKYIKRSLLPNYCALYDSKYDAHLPSEISILARLEHPNIVELQEFSKTDDHFILVMPLHGRHTMDLRQFISRLRAIDEPFCCYVFSQIVNGVDYLHENSILHGDIKADNVIINEEFKCKLIDFGSASYFTDDMIIDNFAGSVSYCAPEVLVNHGRFQGTEVEMYALGVVLYLLNFQDYPLDQSSEFFHQDENLQVASEDLRLLLISLLHHDSSTRCKMIDLLHNEWLNQRVAIEQYDWNKMVWEC